VDAGLLRIEDHAARVSDLTARSTSGDLLDVSKPKPNRWQVQTGGSPAVTLSYRLLAQGRSVTSNWVDADLGVINGGAAFITLAEKARRPHDVRLEMPPTWRQSASGLEPAPGGERNHYRAADFDTLVDSPIVAGDLEIRQFAVDGSVHVIADAGQRSQWNGGAAADKIEKVVREVRTDFLGSMSSARASLQNEGVVRKGHRIGGRARLRRDAGVVRAALHAIIRGRPGRELDPRGATAGDRGAEKHLKALLTSSSPVGPARPRR
jgi:predicted metalloprotease with PDZ domain